MHSELWPASVVEAVARHAQDTPNKLALVVEDREVSYQQLWEAAMRFTSLLAARNVRAGDRVVLRARHTLAYVAAYLGTTLIRGAAVPYETDLPAEQVTELAGRVGAACTFGPEPVGSLAWVKEDYLTSEMQTPAWTPAELPQADDIAELLLTTGTTGRSKVVTLSHRAVMAVEENIVTTTGILSDNVSLVPMPLNHVFALRRLQAGLVCGATVVLIPGVAKLKAVFGALAQHKVTSLSLVPAALAYLQQTTKDYLGTFAGQIRFVESSSAPLPTATRDWLREVLPDSRLYNSYGCTESTAACMLEYSHRSDDGACVGTPCVTAQIAILDPMTGAECAGTGRVAIGGTGVMEGYWGDTEATAATLVDGRVLTNDLGYFQDGELYVLGRIDDVAIIGGHNVSPAEVDDIIIGCDVVSDCACVRGHDDVTGDRLVLFVVFDTTAEGEDEARETLRDYLRAHLEAHKVPSEVRVVESIARTYNGKVDRKALQKLVEG